MKLYKYFFIAALFCISMPPAYSQSEPTKVTPTKDYSDQEATSTDEPSSLTTGALPELIIRPVGVAGSAAGLGLFVLGSPFSGLASIWEPHDAFKITYEDFVKRPFNFTFRRPIGEWGKY